MWIVVMTIPALAFFGLRLLEAANVSSALGLLHETMSVISGLAMLGPLFAIIQLSMIVRGTASATWQNILCVIVTAAAALLAWQGMRMGIG